MRTPWRPASRKASADARRGERRAHAQERGLVGGRDDDDRAGEPLGAEVVLEELAHLAARSPMRPMTETSAEVPRAIIDNSDDLPTPIRRRVPCAGRGPTGGQGVEHAHPERHRGVDAGAVERRRRLRLDGNARRDEGAASVDRAAGRVDDAAEEAGADGDAHAASRRPRAVADAQARGGVERHRRDGVFGDRGDLGARAVADLEEVTDGGVEARDADPEAGGRGDDSDLLGASGGEHVAPARGAAGLENGAHEPTSSARAARARSRAAPMRASSSPRSSSTIEDPGSTLASATISIPAGAALDAASTSAGLRRMRRGDCSPRS